MICLNRLEFSTCILNLHFYQKCTHKINEWKTQNQWKLTCSICIEFFFSNSSNHSKHRNNCKILKCSHSNPHSRYSMHIVCILLLFDIHCNILYSVNDRLKKCNDFFFGFSFLHLCLISTFDCCNEQRYVDQDYRQRQILEQWTAFKCLVANSSNKTRICHHPIRRDWCTCRK